MTDALTPAERGALAPYFSNLDGPVFALVNLPEVVKGALFARYSRSPKALRRLFLEEFAGELGAGGDGEAAGRPPARGLARAEELYARVFVEYGDDSVAQLGGVHLACEGVSNVLTKVLEWGRLMAYLEQSTRYVPYDDQPGGRYRYFREADIMASPRARAYETTVETTIYCAPESTGKGIGRRLYAELFAALAAEDINRIVAGYTLPNPASAVLHSRFGFKPLGIFS